MKTLIAKWNIQKIYHFTDKSNLKSIKTHGLLSLEEIDKMNIAVSKYGGNDWSHEADKQKGLDKYIHLSFRDNHPMLYTKVKSGEIKDPYILEICPSMMIVEGVLFTDDVSNKSGIVPFNSTFFEIKLDCNILFEHTDWRDETIQQRLKKAEKSEILIPNHIPINKILNI